MFIWTAAAAALCVWNILEMEMYINRRRARNYLGLGWPLFRLSDGIFGANNVSDAFWHADSDSVIKNTHFEIFLPAPAEKSFRENGIF